MNFSDLIFHFFELDRMTGCYCLTWTQTKETKQRAEESTNTEIQLPKLICTQLPLKQIGTESNCRQQGWHKIWRHEFLKQRHFPPKLCRTRDDLNMCSRIPLARLISIARISKFTVGLVESWITWSIKKLQERVAPSSITSGEVNKRISPRQETFKSCGQTTIRGSRHLKTRKTTTLELWRQPGCNGCCP